VAAALLVTSGVGVDEAIDAVSTARGQTIPETPVQLQWISIAVRATGADPLINGG